MKFCSCFNTRRQRADDFLLRSTEVTCIIFRHTAEKHESHILLKMVITIELSIMSNHHVDSFVMKVTIFDKLMWGFFLESLSRYCHFRLKGFHFYAFDGVSIVIRLKCNYSACIYGIRPGIGAYNASDAM